MKTFHKDAPFSTGRFHGRIEAIKVARQFGDRAHMAYLRINEGTEGARVLQDLSVGNTVGSYLQEGEHCTLYAVGWDGRERILYALETQGAKSLIPRGRRNGYSGL